MKQGADKGPSGWEEDEKVGQRVRGGGRDEEQRGEKGRGTEEKRKERIEKTRGGDPGPLGRHKGCCQEGGGSQDTWSRSVGVAPGECWSGAAQAWDQARSPGSG